MENEKGSGSIKDLKTDSYATNNGGDPLSKSEKKSLSCSSSSSSSSKSFDQDDKGVNQPEWSKVSASPRGGTGPSPRVSPPIQMTDQPGSSDPNRIPASVFTSSPKDSSGMNWSVTSNESLFSIHMGTNSFSREHLMTKSGELINSPSYNDFISLTPTLPTVTEMMRSSKDSNKDCETPKMGPKKETHNKDKTGTSKMDPPYPALANPRLSGDSGNNSKSFAFPVLAGDCSVKKVPDTPHMTRKSKLEPEPEPKPKQEAKPETSQQSAPTTQNSWFPCLSCCPFCS